MEGRKTSLVLLNFIFIYLGNYIITCNALKHIHYSCGSAICLNAFLYMCTQTDMSGGNLCKISKISAKAKFFLNFSQRTEQGQHTLTSRCQCCKKGYSNFSYVKITIPESDRKMNKLASKKLILYLLFLCVTNILCSNCWVIGVLCNLLNACYNRLMIASYLI